MHDAKLNRRVFLCALGGVTTGLMVPRRGEPSDLVWGGWRQPWDQAVMVGFWYKPLPDSRLLVSTTLGHVGVYHEADSIEFAARPGWNLLLSGASESVKEAVKERAWVALQAAL